jgi:hypothetical protein
MTKQREREHLTDAMLEALEKEYASLREQHASTGALPKGLPFRHMSNLLSVRHDTLLRWYGEGSARNASPAKQHFHEIAGRIVGLFQHRWEANICKIADDVGNRNSLTANEKLLERVEKQVVAATPKQASEGAIPADLLDEATDDEIELLERLAKQEAELTERLRSRKLQRDVS